MKWRFLLVNLLLLAYVNSNDLDDEATVSDFDDELEQPSNMVEDEIQYKSPASTNRHYFSEHFDDRSSFAKRWIKSEAMKDGIDADIAKYDGEWSIEAAHRDGLTGDLGLVLKSKAKHAAISARLYRPFVFSDKPFIVQYEVTLQDGQECGGAYIKLLAAGNDLTKFQDKTPYSIMFGPDKCGNDHKLHFIFKHRNPKNGTYEEKHCKKPTERLEDPFKDKLPHLYTLVIRPDNTFEIRLDHKVINRGSLLEDFTPSVNPPAEIDDPNDKKPENWDEREKIPDPESIKPEDWDEDAPAQIPDTEAIKPDGWMDNEPELIPDLESTKPADWDTEMDGEWEPPMIANPICADAPGCGPWSPPMVNNPEYKGKWRPPMIDNPNYKGKWRPRRIPNPDFFEDKHPFRMSTIDAIGFELWSMSKDILFDNIIITDDMAAAIQWASETFDLKRKKIDKDADTLWTRLMISINYKPGWWALYFIYCSIPIVAYIWYLAKRVREESLWTRIVRFTNDNPWIWAVYVLVIGLPLVLIVFMCCTTTTASREKEEMRRAAEAKKTDAVTSDDPHIETEDVKEPSAVPEKDVQEEPTEEVEEEKEVELISDENVEETQEEEKEQPNDDIAAGDAPRKRRPRKD